MKAITRRIVLSVAAIGLAIALGVGLVVANTQMAAAQTTPATPAVKAATPAVKAGKNTGATFAATISAITGQQVTFTWRGWTRTETVDSSVALAEGKQTIRLSDLKTGDAVVLHFAKNSDGTLKLDAIRKVQPHAAGVVTAVNGSSFTVQHTERKSGKTTDVTVNTDSTTIFSLGKKTGTLTDVTVGAKVTVVGSRNSDGSLNATQVHIAKTKGMK